MELRLRIISLLAVWNVLVEYRMSMPSIYLAHSSETGYGDSDVYPTYAWRQLRSHPIAPIRHFVGNSPGQVKQIRCHSVWPNRQ